VAVLVVFSVGTGTARAQDADKARTPDAEKARQLFQQGSKYYDIGQFDRAIEAWQQGYEQKPDPSFLYNIAQAYRQKEDPGKAIFFYKSFLRNSPKPKTQADIDKRSDVDQKIAALQKQLDAKTPTTTTTTTTTTATTTTPPPVATTPPPPTTTTGPTVAVTEPPPPPPPTTPPPADFGETPSGVAVATVPETPAVIVDHRIDVSAAIGSDFWSSGVQGTADPSFAFSLGAGYTFGSSASRVRFRLGALFGYTFLSEVSSHETFVSYMIDPTVKVRLGAGQHWFLTGDLGFGVLAIYGLKPSSALLIPGEVKSVNGTQSLSVTRLGVGLEYRITPELAVFASPAVAGSPKKDHYYAGITRTELLFGLAYRF
jgi:hypothetical protein